MGHNVIGPLKSLLGCLLLLLSTVWFFCVRIEKAHDRL